MRLKMTFLLSSLLTLLSISQAQSLSDWLSRITNTEEHLIHREQVGPYTVNADGQRLLNHPYLKFDIRHNGELIPPESVVTVDTTLYRRGPQGHESYTAEFDGRYFVIDPLELEGAETWTWDNAGWLQLNITVDGPAGPGKGEVGFQIYPPKPATGTLFSVLNFSLPFVVLALFVLTYRFRRVRLQTYSA